jgi:hypothetical protein
MKLPTQVKPVNRPARTDHFGGPAIQASFIGNVACKICKFGCDRLPFGKDLCRAACDRTACRL